MATIGSFNGEWKRKERTTGGADPTQMVEWVFKSEAVTVELTEFQSTVQLELDGKVRGGLEPGERGLQEWAEFTFQALEAAHDMEMDRQSSERLEFEEGNRWYGDGLPSDFHGGEQ